MSPLPFPHISLPYPQDAEPLIEANTSRLFRLVHTAPFPVAVQALMLMWQLLAGRGAVSDRFYRALYAVLATDGPCTSSKATMFLALLFKAMKADPSSKRVAAFAKRLLQSASYGPPAYGCGAVLLLSEVMKVQPSLWAGVQQPEDNAGGYREAGEFARVQMVVVGPGVGGVWGLCGAGSGRGGSHGGHTTTATQPPLA